MDKSVGMKRPGDKRSEEADFSGGSLTKISKLEHVSFDFPDEPTLLTDEMISLRGTTASYIPFRNAGDGCIFISKRLLDQLYNNSKNGSNEKLMCGISILAPNFPDAERCPFDGWREKLQEHWKAEVGSFLLALEKIDKPTHFVLNPGWYKYLNWESIKIICMISDIVHPTYIQESNDGYEWHSDCVLPKFKTEGSTPDSGSVHIDDLRWTEKFKVTLHKAATTIWIIDSEFNYNHLDDTEKEKLDPLRYEYSSGSDYESEEFSKDDLLSENDRLQHGTVMCKIVSSLSAKNSIIHLVKIPRIMKTCEKHIHQGLNYIETRFKDSSIKFNIVLMTLGKSNFRCDKFSPLYLQHSRLHDLGFVFCCSAGNTFAEQPQMHPFSFFINCQCCVVVGTHSINTDKSPALPKKLYSAGCCLIDHTLNNEFIQGVTTWALGENLIIPSLINTQGTQVFNGTSVSTAIIIGAVTYIIPKLLDWKEELQSKLNKKNILSVETKAFLEKCSDLFTCPKHEKQRNLIFNMERLMDMLKHKRIQEEPEV